MQVNVEGYTEWIQLVADLTIHSLTYWQWASSSVYYLLGVYAFRFSAAFTLRVYFALLWRGFHVTSECDRLWASSPVYCLLGACISISSGFGL